MQTVLKRISLLFVKEGGMEALVQISYDPAMHPIPLMKTETAESKAGDEEKDKDPNKKKDETSNVKFGSNVIPAVSNRVLTAQRSIANCYQFLRKECWPDLINALFRTFQIDKIDEHLVAKFQFTTLADVGGDVEELKKRHRNLAQALLLSSRMTCLLSILTRLTRRGEMTLLFESEFHKWMHCLTSVIPGVIWHMTQCDSVDVHRQATSDRQRLVGLYTEEEKTGKNANEPGDTTTNTHVQYYSDAFVNIRYYENQTVSLMNHFTKFLKTALRTYRKAMDSHHKNALLASAGIHDKHVVEYMAYLLHTLTTFQIPRCFLLETDKQANRKVYRVAFWALIQYCEHACHIVETMLLTGHKLLVNDLLKSFIEYGALNRMVLLFRVFVHVLGKCDDGLQNAVNVIESSSPSSSLPSSSSSSSSLAQLIKTLFIRSDNDNDMLDNVDVAVEFDKEGHLYDTLRSAITQFANLWHLLMKAPNVNEIDRNLGFSICVELTSLWKSPWFSQRNSRFTFKDFALIHKGKIQLTFFFFLRRGGGEGMSNGKKKNKIIFTINK
ncbi:hypothetical protein RFI_10804 [Reticulomyxa filosa]|uniref:Uncharacterized protein n=1 Tax=Reticulomyxa filosa TaxID=46433 RepID=X6NK94_RETFI|nr:hypothetical protein RFI_10804 [Reticulomyxa filosa]|eukprot:ETO26333.1 hypothetical protein RFI_10804 [Reticulomyxa filosa]